MATKNSNFLIKIQPQINYKPDNQCPNEENPIPRWTSKIEFFLRDATIIFTLYFKSYCLAESCNIYINSLLEPIIKEHVFELPKDIQNTLAEMLIQNLKNKYNEDFLYLSTYVMFNE